MSNGNQEANGNNQGQQGNNQPNFLELPLNHDNFNPLQDIEAANAPPGAPPVDQQPEQANQAAINPVQNNQPNFLELPLNHDNFNPLQDIEAANAPPPVDQQPEQVNQAVIVDPVQAEP